MSALEWGFEICPQEEDFGVGLGGVVDFVY